MNIGLLGFGVVGRGVYEIVENRKDMAVTKVLCRRDLGLPAGVETRDMGEILADPAIDTVVEVLGGLHPAYEYVRGALEAGKNVVTANKALIAAYYDDLTALATEKGVSLRCTAAVGGGIGWLSEVERARRIQKIESLRGIMNGTCNYILDNMTTNGLSYETALKQAQALGYAEADPSADVDGIDTWNKTIISANVAFGVSMDRETVPVAGIRNISAGDVAQFAAHGLVCKLMGCADGENAYVQPTLVKGEELEANVPMNYNCITFQGEISGTMSFYGQGAGRYPTAYNVVQDLADVQAGKSFYAKAEKSVAAKNEKTLSFYVRGPWEGSVQEAWGEGVLTGPVAVREMHTWAKAHPEAFFAGLA